MSDTNRSPWRKGDRFRPDKRREVRLIRAQEKKIIRRAVCATSIS